MNVSSELDSLLVAVENIGGISESTVDVHPGVNVLSGRNASNRTSFLRAVAAGLGSRNVSLKSDTSTGSVTLSFNDENYRRDLSVDDDTLTFTGDSALSDQQQELAERFGLLFEQNQARQAIRQNDELRPVVMDPVDTAAIQQEIETLQSERADIESRITDLEEQQSELPELEAESADLRERIEQLEGKLETKRSELEASREDIAEKRAQENELDQTLNQLHETESEMEEVEENIQSTEDLIESLKSDRDSYQAELSELEDVDADRIDELDSELAQLRERLSRKESMMTELQNVIDFNADLLDDTEDAGILDETPLGDTQATGSVTDKLLDDESFICWTCGQETTQSEVAETVDRLQSVHEDLYGERRQLQSELDELQTEKQNLLSIQKKRENIDSSLQRVEQKLQRQQETLDTLTARRDELADRHATLEQEVNSLRDEQESEMLDLHEEINRLEFELEQARNRKEEVATQIAEREGLDDEIEQYQAQVDDIRDNIEQLRDRVENLERQTIEAFNDNMDAILEKLAYDNLDRIWLERKEVTTRQGRRNVEQSVFELHVVREGEDGTVYEDTLATLSESEREVTGIIFALAGYLAHGVDEFLPVMILDSLEAIDSDRIARLVEYLSDYTEYLLVALLPEDADALPEEYNYVTDI